MKNLLAIIPKDGNWYFDNFSEGLVYALIGFLVVFLGIVLIIFIIWILGLILSKSNNLEFLSKFIKKIKTSLAKTFKRKKKTETSGEVIAFPDDEEIPDEIKAAVIAAIMAYYSQEQPECEFRVKRIKRI